MEGTPEIETIMAPLSALAFEGRGLASEHYNPIYEVVEILIARDAQNYAIRLVRSVRDAINVCCTPAVGAGTTHWEDCWRVRGHQACAVAKIEKMLGEEKP